MQYCKLTKKNIVWFRSLLTEDCHRLLCRDSGVFALGAVRLGLAYGVLLFRATEHLVDILYLATAPAAAARACPGGWWTAVQLRRANPDHRHLHLFRRRLGRPTLLLLRQSGGLYHGGGGRGDALHVQNSILQHLMDDGAKGMSIMYKPHANEAAQEESRREREAEQPIVVALPNVAAQRFVKVAVPAPIIPHSFCSPELLTHIAYEKYVNGMPLYRLEKDFAAHGVLLSRATMRYAG